MAFMERVADLACVFVLIQIHERQNAPRPILRRTHLDRLLQHPHALRVVAGLGEHHAEVPISQRRRLERDRLAERGRCVFEFAESAKHETQIVLRA